MVILLAHPQMVDGLFAVCVTLGTVPIIRCPKGNAAEAVATKLDAKLRENLKDTRNSLFSSGNVKQKTSELLSEKTIQKNSSPVSFNFCYYLHKPGLFVSRGNSKWPIQFLPPPAGHS